MDNNESNKQNKALDKILEQICNNYSYITPDKILFFAPVFYPIANIELQMQEKTFEDFEPVQLAVLNLINIGYNDPNILAKLLGLNAIYIEKIQKLLYGYQLVDDNNRITDTGKESLKEEKMIQLVDTKQIFQLDPINLSLIKLDKTLNNEKLKDKKFLSKDIAIIDHPNYIDSDIIKSNILDSDFKSIWAQKRGILNTNVLNIKDINCAEISYIKAFAISLKGISQPLIFSKREDFTQKKSAEKYKWLPFSVPNQEIANCLNLKDFVFSNHQNQIYINDKMGFLVEHTESEIIKENINNCCWEILQNHSITPDCVSYNSEQYYLIIKNEFAFNEVKKDVIKDIYLLAKNGLLLSTNESFGGRVIHIIIDNMRLKSAAKKLFNIIESQNMNSVNQNIQLVYAKIEKMRINNPTMNIVELIELMDISELSEQTIVSRYKTACTQFESKEYADAYQIFRSIVYYKDSSEKFKTVGLIYANELVNKKDYFEAEKVLTEIGQHENSSELLESCLLELINIAYKSGQYYDVIQYCKRINNRNQINDVYVDSCYLLALNLRSYGEYLNAIYWLEQCGNYKNAEKLIFDVKWNYIKENNFDSSNQTIYKYLKELKDSGDEDAKEIFNDLYKWRVKLEAANEEKDDNETIAPWINRKTAYFHYNFRLYGGEPGETASFYYTIILPTGETYKSEWYWRDCTAGGLLGCEWCNGFSIDPGMVTFRIFNNETDEFIGSASIRVK